MNNRSVLVEEDLRTAANAFQRDGVAVVRGVFSLNEIRELTNESDRLWSEQEDLVPQNIRVGLRKNLAGDVTLERLDPVADISEKFARVNADSRMLAIATAALRQSPIVLKEKLIYKWPGTSGYGAHRDEPYFGTSGVPGAEMVSVSLALDAANAENGSVMFYPKLRNAVIEAPEDESRDLLSDALDPSAMIQPELMPGDIVFFDGLVPHCSDFNHSSGCRRIYTVTYGPACFPACRENYYSARLIEMERERRHEFPGPYFIR